jgi:hypothetical protein
VEMWESLARFPRLVGRPHGFPPSRHFHRREGLRRLEQEETGPSPAALRDPGTVIRLIQREARRAGLDALGPAGTADLSRARKMSKREVNAEIEAARKEMAAKTIGVLTPGVRAQFGAEARGEREKRK